MKRRDIATRWGTMAETRVRRWLVEERHQLVLPAYAIEDGGAPMLKGLVKKLVLPDMLGSAGGESRWAEVKYKDSPVLYNKSGEWRHGVDTWKWEAYLEVERETGIPGDLAVVQLRPGPHAPLEPRLLLAPFASLALVAREHRGGDVAKVWWAVDAFEWFDIDLDEDAVRCIPRLAPMDHPWERPDRFGRAPAAGPPPPTLF